VAPAEIESVLLLHPDVIDAAVVAVKNNTVGDLPRAYVVTRTSSAPLEDILNFVNGNQFEFEKRRFSVATTQLNLGTFNSMKTAKLVGRESAAINWLWSV
jgi:acyl-CoA synthetase (AMP-forming)/AMP-acid ligase II